MSKPIANVEIATDSYQQLFEKINQVLDTLSKEVVTANTTLGNTSGNMFVNGIVGGNNVVVVNELRGGSLVTNSSSLPELVSANLTISSNVVIVSGSSFTSRGTALFSNATSFTGNATFSGNVLNINSQNTTVTGNATFSGSQTRFVGDILVLGTGTGLSANGSIGANGQVLVSNGTTAYWANVSATSNVTVVDSVTNTSPTFAASANSVKTAYDTAVLANTIASNAQNTAITLSNAAFANAAIKADSAFSNAIAHSSNASNLVTGTVPPARLSGTYSINITGSAGSASSVSWSGVSGRPTAISSFTIDRGWRYQTADYTLGGRVWVQSSQPTGVSNGDIWITL